LLQQGSTAGAATQSGVAAPANGHKLLFSLRRDGREARFPSVHFSTGTEAVMSVIARIFSSRKVWIALAGVAACIITILGADPEKWTPLITAIVTLSGVVIASIGIEDGAAKFSGEFTETVKDAVNDSKSLLPLLLVGVLLTCIGCVQQDPVAIQADQARRTAIEPVVKEYVQHHPSQRQQWTDFLTAWQKSIDSRKSALSSGQ